MAEKKTTKKAAAPKAEEPKKAAVKKAAAPKKAVKAAFTVNAENAASWLLLTRRLHLLNQLEESIKGLEAAKGLPAFF